MLPASGFLPPSQLKQGMQSEQSQERVMHVFPSCPPLLLQVPLLTSLKYPQERLIKEEPTRVGRKPMNHGFLLGVVAAMILLEE